MLVREVITGQRGRDSLSGIMHTLRGSIELVQVLEGSGSFLADGDLFPLRRGAVVLLDSDCLHCSMPEETEDYVRNKLLLDRNEFLSVSRLADDELGRGRCFLLDEETTLELNGLFLRLGERESRECWDTVADVARMMALCRRDGDHLETAGSTKDPILEYINEHLDQPLTLEILARDTHFSKYYLCSLFRRKTGMTPMQYVRLLRISRAQRLLLTTNESISNIGIACGYDNFSFFCRVFRSISGMSPSAYRKGMGGRESEQRKLVKLYNEAKD